MKIGERGQITIPKPLRDRFGLNTSQEVECIEDRGELILRRVSTTADAQERLKQNIKAVTGILNGQPDDVDTAIDDMRGL